MSEVIFGNPGVISDICQWLMIMVILIYLRQRPAKKRPSVYRHMRGIPVTVHGNSYPSWVAAFRAYGIDRKADQSRIIYHHKTNQKSLDELFPKEKK
jgi:hypothetical protein